MNNIKNYYTSDLHYNHHALYVGGARAGFSSARECEDLIRKNFNAEIRPCDNLYILGDLCLSSDYDDLANYLRSINGNKIVILGNHDKPKTLDRLKADRVIANWHPWKGCHEGDLDIFMTHFVPLEAHVGPTLRLYLHGHVHGTLKSLINCPLRIDVGVDAQDFKPFSTDKINRELINGIRFGCVDCPNRVSGMLCDVCAHSISISKKRLSEIRTDSV